jgi:hypothetical protein
MKPFYILIILLFAMKGAVAVADDRKMEVEAMVKEAVEQPTEYEFPAEELAKLKSFQASHNVLGSRIAEHNKVIVLMQEKIKTCEANRSHDAASIVHTMRTYLASKGVPLKDLDNWHIVNDKAVRKPDKKE